MQRNLLQLSRRVYDVLIIGGGIYGIFMAWDAALRGLSVALVERGDFGHATSSNTLRIIHGGLRYLQHGDLRRVRRSLYERRVFMQMAPHLVHPLPFLIPTYGQGRRGRAAFALALRLHDLLGFERSRLSDPRQTLPPGRIISRQMYQRLVPGMEASDLTGGAIFYEGQLSHSERFVLAAARSAAQVGAELANYVEVTGLLIDKERVAGATARDVLTGEAWDMRARLVINASGPWIVRLLCSLPGRPSKHQRRFSKAFNLLVNRQLVPHYAVGVYSTGLGTDRQALLPKHARLFFITPYHGQSLIGTAHLPYDTDPESFKVTDWEIQGFLDDVNAAYPAADLKFQEVSFVYGGLLPASSSSTGDAQLLKRPQLYDHRLEDGVDGLISVCGVKFTEARYVAEKAVDLAFRKLHQPAPPSATAITPLYGGQMECFSTFVSQETQHPPTRLEVQALGDLIGRYGTAYTDVLRYLSAEPPASLVDAEVLHAVREEMAQKLADVVFRRTALGTRGYPGIARLNACAAIMARELGWDATRTHREVDEVRMVFGEQTAVL